MQLLLTFAQKPSNESEVAPISEVWASLQSEQRNETLGVLARLLAKTAAASADASSIEKRKDRHDD